MPGTEAGHDDTIRTKFLMQRLTEDEHISLGRRIGRVARNGLEAYEAGDEKDVSRSPHGHVPAEEIGQLRERRDVELDHVDGAFDRGFQKAAVQAVSGIVHRISIATDFASRLLFRRPAATG